MCTVREKLLHTKLIAMKQGSIRYQRSLLMQLSFIIVTIIKSLKTFHISSLVLSLLLVILNNLLSALEFFYENSLYALATEAQNLPPFYH